MSYSSITSPVFTLPAIQCSRAHRSNAQVVNMPRPPWFSSEMCKIAQRLKLSVILHHFQLTMLKSKINLSRAYFFLRIQFKINLAICFSHDEYQDPKQRRENKLNSLLEDYMSGTDTERPVIESDIICDPAMNECRKNEICKKSNNRRRQGICLCINGWARDEQRVCRPISKKDIHQVLSDESLDRTESTVISNNTTEGKGGAPPVDTHLVVSAGQNQVIQLPLDETTLSAFVIQSPKSKSYKYEWQLIAKPSTTEEVGNMEGSNTEHLKLSHLKAGNYTFKLIVTDGDLKGSNEVNVTVLPPKRVNKPPVAVIQPANSTVQLPNKDTVLDASFSTDDNSNKIVKYEW